MHIRSIGIAGAMVVEGQAHTDHRGAFSRLFCERELAEVISDRHVVQINHSRTNTVGAVRGKRHRFAARTQSPSPRFNDAA